MKRVPMKTDKTTLCEICNKNVLLHDFQKHLLNEHGIFYIDYLFTIKLMNNEKHRIKD